MDKIIIIAFLYVSTTISFGYEPAPVVTIDQGVIKGKLSRNGEYYEYLGIPYGSVKNTTRFQAPLPPPKWDGVFDATEATEPCPRMYYGRLSGDEDCLTVNIYVPSSDKGPYPVIFLIQAGEFQIGFEENYLYSPEFLVRQDVIFVTFYYRTSILGFLCLGIKEAPGNAGLKDQLAALKWVNRNIQAFQGDPNRITIFGTSAGAMSVSLMQASPATVGLYHRIIQSSGSSLAPMAINRNPLKSASTFVKILGFDTENPKEIYDILSEMDYKYITGVVDPKYLRTNTSFLISNYFFEPCVEKKIEGVEAYLDDEPYYLLMKNRKPVSAILGMTDKEALFLIPRENKFTLKLKNNMNLFGHDLVFPNKNELRKTSDKIKRFYFGNKTISLSTISELTELLTDLNFYYPIITETQININDSNQNVFNYIFEYSGGRNRLKIINGQTNVAGASHGDDTLYIYNATSWPFPITKEDQKMIDTCTRLWTNFAKYGDPTPPFDTELPVKWTPSTKQGLNFLHINSTLRVDKKIKPSYDFWNKIYLEYRKINNY